MGLATPYLGHITLVLISALWQRQSATNGDESTRDKVSTILPTRIADNGLSKVTSRVVSAVQLGLYPFNSRWCGAVGWLFSHLRYVRR
ncbi:hypothetical protein LZ30DRAFT_698782 [Colletotrichum cereale]|nr:hypothetical protein LZ30DRAFT_698782 [Colletotrichum cereale]